jgi:hypothetical protein
MDLLIGLLVMFVILPFVAQVVLACFKWLARLVQSA